MNRYGIFFMITLSLLSIYLSAQQRYTQGTSPVELKKEHLIGKIASMEIYLYDENLLLSTNTDSIIWLSHPNLILFLKTDNIVNSYPIITNFSQAMYNLLIYIEKCDDMQVLYKETLKIVTNLLGLYGDCTEMKYEFVNGDRYGYWIYYWLHFFKQHDYSYRPPMKQNQLYTPTHGLLLSILQNSEECRRKIADWQCTTYGRTAIESNLYDLEENNCFLLESVFDDEFIRYDLVLKHSQQYRFYLTINSFMALLNELDIIFNHNLPFNVMKTLCLIDLFYTQPDDTSG